MKTDTHYQALAKLALQWMLEPEDGAYYDPVHPGIFNRVFDARVLDFRHDANRALRAALAPAEYLALILVHRDGLTPREACTVARQRHPGWRHEGSPVSALERIEIRVGLALEGADLGDVRDYFLA